MPQLHIINALANVLGLLKSQDRKVITSWDNAAPISLQELEVKLTALQSLTDEKIIASTAHEFGTDSFEQLLMQLELMWEQMEDLEDCSVV